MSIFSFFCKKKSPPADEIRSGCEGNCSCQYQDLGTASKAGKPKNVAYCRYEKEFVVRRKKCEHFLSHGCANGMCAHANTQNGGTYCKYYQCTVTPSESCPDYLDFFDTPDGDALRNLF